MTYQGEVDIVVKGIEISWTTWGKMRGEKLVTGDIAYLKSEGERGFERIYAIDVRDNQAFRIQQMVALIKAGILPDSMLITPNTRPANLAATLARKGFVISDADPCMLMHLDGYSRPDASAQSGFAIVDVTEMGRLADWLGVVNAALFGCELVTLEQFGDILALDDTRFFLGLHDGKPVTACMTIASGDTSVLEMVATLEDCRRRGFASAVIDRALSDLRQRGIKTVSLRAEADGVGVYQKLGFKTCFQRVVARCDWENVHRKSCPCRMEDEKIEHARRIFEQSDSVEAFVTEMARQGVIGRKIWHEPSENAIYITKMYACDCGGSCPSNDTCVGQRCHCEYMNHLTEGVPISYCKGAAHFYEPMFCPLFGEHIRIEAVQTVLSGADECTFRIRL